MNLSVGPVAGLGRLRKIGLVGCSDSFQHTPWQDPTWELWAHASACWLIDRIGETPARYFDLHLLPDRHPQRHSRYLAWLKRNRVPIFMAERYPGVPAVLRYPKERILMEFRPYVTNHVGWMVALALTEGVTHLGLFGITYTRNAERIAQRGSAEYWLGLAEGRGVQLVMPPGCDLLHSPPELYGYESHPGGVLSDSYRVKGWLDGLDTTRTKRGLRQSAGRQRHRARNDRRRIERHEGNHAARRAR